MEQGIVITPTLRQKFQWAWEQRQVIFFSAPCGFGKTAAASVLLEPYAVCRWDAMDTGPPEPVPDCEAALVDNLQELKNPNAQKALLAAIRENPEIHFILLGRNRTLYTLQLNMRSMFMEYFTMWDVALAGLVMILIPTVIFFVAAQKHIIGGLTSGSVKG